VGQNKFSEQIRKIEVVNLRFSFIFIPAILLSSSAAGQDTAKHFEHPANRLVFFEEGGQSVAYSSDSITARFIGITNPKVQQRVLANTIYYGDAAKTEVNIIGFPNAMFDEALPVSDDANFVIFSYDHEDEPVLKNGDFHQSGLGAPFDQTEPNNQHGYSYGSMNGNAGECLYAVQHDDRGGLNAFALAISSSNSEEEALNCVRDGILTGFGFNPYISEYSFAITTGSDEETTFYDYSEATLGLMAASFCRDEVGDRSISCIAELIHSTYLNHGRLLNKYVR
jgi:hypothetical protein